MKALVIGGSGSSGLPVLHGLLERGHEVTMLHRGVHEPPGLPDVPHIHADPHFAETLTEAVGDREFDVVLAMYGRVSIIADVFAKRCGQLVSIGGVPAYRGCLQPDRVKPYGMAVNAREDGPLSDSAEPVPKFAKPIRAAERAVFEHAANGDFQGSVVRYCAIYGPRNLVPWEWSVVKRVLDGRQQMIMPDQGLGIISRCAARNAAEVVLKVVDNPAIADGQAYNVGDDDQYSIRQWAEAVATIMGAELEFVPIPSEVAGSALMELYPPTGAAHILLDNNKAKRELGYRQVVPASEALAEAVEWIQANPVTKEEYPLYPAKFDYEAEDRLIEAYARAMEWVREQAPDLVPAYHHPMPHPKKAAVGRDESGR
jgi:nucleoside-diphosphate-sugar epimerase